MRHVSASDLAPGDGPSTRLDFSALRIDEVRSGDDPLFALGYEALEKYFGRGKSVELPDALAQRMQWSPGGGMRYALFVVRDQAGELAAVRDHTAIESSDRHSVTVHLSHLLVMPAWRRSGLAGWMRALPLATAREVQSQAPVTLVAEMGAGDSLKAYARAGFLQVDPAAVQYLQPDFRTVVEIEADRRRPVPFSLVLRRVGREREAAIPAAELRRLVGDLYRMYAQTCRPQDMPSLAAYPAESFPPIRLRPPA